MEDDEEDGGWGRGFQISGFPPRRPLLPRMPWSFCGVVRSLFRCFARHHDHDERASVVCCLSRFQILNGFPN